MVTSNTTVDLRKRKKTTDMPDSPPKRVTRARAKATEESGSALKTTKITTASARIADESKAAGRVATAIKRKARAEETKAKHDLEIEADQPVVIEQPKARGRPKKITKEVVGDAEMNLGLPRTRSHQSKVEVDNEGSNPQSVKPKSRARKLAKSLTGEDAKHEGGVVVPEPVRKTARARLEASKEKFSNEATQKLPTLRKRVTFQANAQDDKENLGLEAEKKTDAKSQPTGLRAKPVRKPATAKASVRGKKAVTTKEKMETRAATEANFKPLSPKKVTQVAKSTSSSISSEDELCGDKTPTRVLSKSPVKPTMTSMKSPHKNISTAELASLPVSPTKLSASSTMTSPARRLPPTPFKDTLRESPKKVKLIDPLATSVLVPSFAKDLLKESPKRVNLACTNVMTTFTTSKTPLKASLLQSPARRPPSTFKPMNTRSLKETVQTTPAVNTKPVSENINRFQLPVFTPGKLISIPLHTDRSGQVSVKVRDTNSDDGKSCCDTETIDEQNDFLMDRGGQEGSPMLETPVERVEASGDATSPRLQNESLVSPYGSGIEVLNEELFRPQGITAPGNTTSVDNPSDVASLLFRQQPDDSDSEDELQSFPGFDTTPISNLLDSFIQTVGEFGTPTPATAVKTPISMFRRKSAQRKSHRRSTSRKGTSTKSTDYSMTPLATQLSSWLASSPEKQNELESHKELSAEASPTKTFQSRLFQVVQSSPVSSPIKSTLFDDEMLVREQEATVAAVKDKAKDDMATHGLSRESQETEQYGDENTMPMDPQLFVAQPAHSFPPATCTPARIFQHNSREIHTVTKVPLRPAADDSPLRLSRPRSRSMTTPLTELPGHGRPIISRSSTVISYSLNGDDTVIDNAPKEMMAPTQSGKTDEPALQDPSTPSNNAWLSFATPTGSVHKGADSQVLRGAVVFVDVHTTEGADASGIFIELLGQMGARCVKQWTWNPRASFGTASGSSVLDQSDVHSDAVLNGKVGITHVVYKDGGKRTLEKVRDSKGLVLCVGVGWVLE